MRFPSLHNFAEISNRIGRRFPVVLLSALSAVIVGVIGLHHPDGPTKELLFRTVLSCAMGISLAYAVTLFNEENFRGQPLKQILMFAVAALIPVLHHLSFNHLEENYMLRLVQLGVFSHLMAALAVHWNRDNQNGLWQFNWLMLNRFVTSAIYSAVLFAGLAMAIWAVNKLLGLKFREQAFGDLWLVLAFLYNTWFFLAGIPDNIKDLDNVTGVPRTAKVFALFVLMPLALVYMLILYAYTAQILIKWEWPSGTVGWLVSGYAFFGILAHLILVPMEDDPEHTTVRLYNRWFYILLFPLVILLLMAAQRRIAEYGITEKRYFLVVLAGWLGLLSIYFGFLKRRNIKMIPITLAVICLATVTGPWSAYSVSLNHQLSRFKTILGQHGLMENGKVKKATGEIPLKDIKQLSSIADYITKNHGIEPLQPLFDQSLEKTMGNYRYDGGQKIMGIIGLNYVSRWEEKQGKWGFNYATPQLQSGPVNVSGFSTLHQFQVYPHHMVHPAPEQTKSDFRIEASSTSSEIKVTINGQQQTIELESFLEKVRTYLKTPESNNNFLNIPVEVMTIDATVGQARVKFLFKNINGTQDNSQASFNSLEGLVLIKNSK